MPKPMRSDPKVPKSIPDRLGYAPRIEIPTNFNIYPTELPEIGPSGDNTVAPKKGGGKYPSAGSQPAPSRPNAGPLRKHGLG